jgi:alpha-beta hydrolase superfamily lysophospholipase
VKVAIAEARELGSPLTVAGFSLGGLLAAYAAQCEPVDRVVSIAPFFGVPWLPKALNFLGTRALGVVPRDTFLWWHPFRREGYAGEGYPRYPLGAVRTAFELRDALFAAALAQPPATTEISILTNRKDTTCHRGLIHELAERWRSNGARVAELSLPDIGPSHDFMTPLPTERGERVREHVYPMIVDILCHPGPSTSSG